MSPLPYLVKMFHILSQRLTIPNKNPALDRTLPNTVHYEQTFIHIPPNTAPNTSNPTNGLNRGIGRVRSGGIAGSAWSSRSTLQIETASQEVKRIFLYANGCQMSTR